MKSKIHKTKTMKKMNKTIKFFTVLAFSLLLTSCNGQDKKKTTSLNTNISKIEVLDFHSTHRCMTCNAIEANTKYTLETYFSEVRRKQRARLGRFQKSVWGISPAMPHASGAAYREKASRGLETYALRASGWHGWLADIRAQASTPSAVGPLGSFVQHR